MNNDLKKLMFVVVPIACLYLFNGSVNAGNSVAERENAQTVEPMEKTAIDAGRAGEQSDSENENIIEPEDWFNEETEPGVTQVSEDEIVFLSPQPETRTLHSINGITVTGASLDNGWVQVRQCYEGLDAVPAAEVVYQYRHMRGLRILSKSNIGAAVTHGQTVQLSDVQHHAAICVQLEARILYAQADGRFLLRNGPFHRRFLDGYFPLHVSMDVQFPTTLLRYLDTSPLSQPGFKVDVKDEHVFIDSWFAGTLNIEVDFSER